MGREQSKAFRHPHREVSGCRITLEFSSGSLQHSQITELRPIMILCDTLPLPQCLGELTGGLRITGALPSGVILLFSHTYLNSKPLSFRTPGCYISFFHSHQILVFLSHILHLYQHMFALSFQGCFVPRRQAGTRAGHSWTQQKIN